jgi:membrane-anchored mycosin MYCP
MARVTASADRPGAATGHDDAVGAGTVDPVAAVADVRPDEFTGDGPASVSPAGAGRVDLTDGRDAHSGSRTVALAGSAGAMALLGGAGLIVLVARRARRSR